MYLVKDIYEGIKEDIKETKERVNKLDESFQSAYKAAIDVQQLTTSSRDLQHDVADARQRVSILEELQLGPIGELGESLAGKFKAFRGGRIMATPPSARKKQ